MESVSAATQIASLSNAGGSLYTTVYLASDSSTISGTTTTSGHIDNTTSGSYENGEGLEFSCITFVQPYTTDINLSTYSSATYQIDLSFVVNCSLGIVLDPTHLYGFDIHAIPDGYHIAKPDGSVVACTAINSYVLYQGERYDCAEGWQVDFMKHTTNGHQFKYVIDMTYLVTTPTSGSHYYDLGINVSTVNASVYDYGLYNSTDNVSGAINQGNQIAQQGNQIAEEQIIYQSEGNRINQEQNNILSGLTGNITDFFGSFFENLAGIFVPESGYFEEYFSRLNTFFSDKLGMLYAPIGILIDFLTALLYSGSGSASLVFPEVAFTMNQQRYVFIESQNINMASYGQLFPELQDAIYFITNVMMVGAVLMLLCNKLKEVLTT